ncbi:MAG: Gfo/Idh/MocA family oxidoreductase [Bryobacterales bacterium]|nr:Gfo/Idh/MocA family oxidoreductase [Bryobacterales bacterium]
MNENMARRSFLGAAGAGMAAAAEVAGAQTVTQGSIDGRPIRIGFVGVGDRGSYHLDAALGIDGVEVPALCDIDAAYLHRAKGWVEAAGKPSPRLYGKSKTDFERLCAEEDLDCVICSTSWRWHAPVLLAAMRNGKHAVSEVPIVLTLDEAWEIVETWESTGRWGTLGLEGFRSLAVANMVWEGLLGDVIHAEAGYVHDLRLVKFDPEREPWRLAHSMNRNGNLYPDHPMSAIMPALDINHGDRFDFLVSMSSKAVCLNRFAGHYYGEEHPLSSMEMKQGDFNATLIRTAGGKLVTLNFDTNTPHPRSFYRLQGTQGVYFGDRYTPTRHALIYLDGVSPQEHRWEPAGPWLEQYQHAMERDYNPPPRPSVRGHGGRQSRTPLEWHRLVLALNEGRLPDWDVYDSVTSSAISALSEQSVASGSRPVQFPDFTRGKWKDRPRLDLA